MDAPAGPLPEDVETLDGAVLYRGDCLDVLPRLQAKADLVVTSPPYLAQRTYDLPSFDWDTVVPPAIAAVPAHDRTQIFVNLGLVHRDGACLPYWDRLIGRMRSRRWRLSGWYVWDQGPGLPGEWRGRLAPSHEFVFHFNRKARPVNKIVPCVNAGMVRTKSNRGFRKSDGELSGWSQKDRPTQAMRVPDSVIRVMRHKRRGTIECAHPAIYPVELPRLLIAAFSDPGDLVLDPFMGSGTTGVAARELGRRFIGIELNADYFDIARTRIREATRQADLFEPPARAEQLGLLEDGGG